MPIHRFSVSYPYNHPQLMCVSLHLLVEDAGFIDVVNTDTAAGVDNRSVSEHHAYMDDASLFIMEEGQVAETGLVDEVEGFTTQHLLGGVAGQLHTD